MTGLVYMAIGLSLTGFSEAHILYQELYSGPSQVPSDIGWHFNIMPIGVATTVSVGTGGGGDYVPAGGSVNSYPTHADTDHGYMYIGQGNFLFWTAEYTLDRDTWADLTFRWSYAHDGVLVNPMRAAIRIGNQWFVSDPPVEVSGCCWAPNWRLTIDLTACHWRTLYFEENVILELGGNVPYIPAGDITAFGVFADPSNGNKRMDTFTVEGQPVGAQLALQVIPAQITSVHPGPTIHQYSWGKVVALNAWDYVECPEVYRFDHWIGDVANPGQAQTTITMNANKTVTAVFAATRNCGDDCHPYPFGDVNQDCRVDVRDYSILVAEWLGL